MAVTILAADLAVALRLTATTAEYANLEAGQQAVVARTLATASAMVTRYAVAAPDTAHNEAVVRLSAWLYDTDPSDARRAQSPMLQSGAAAILAPWRTAAAALPTGEPAPSTGSDTVDTAAVNALIETAVSPIRAKQMPVSNAEADAGTSTTIRGFTVAIVRRIAERFGVTDQTARDAAAAAELKADTAETTATQNLALISGLSPRVPIVALPAPSQATRGHALGQSATDETYVFRAGGEASDGAARAAAAAAQKDADDNRELIGRVQEVTLRLHAVPGTSAVVTALSAASMLVHTDPPPTNQQGVASMDQPDGGWNENARVFVRLRSGEDRTNYAIRFTGDNEEPYIVPGAHWRQRANLSADHYTFWEAWDRNISTLVGKVELILTGSDTIYDGLVRQEIEAMVGHYQDGLHVGPIDPLYQTYKTQSKRSVANLARTTNTVNDVDESFWHARHTSVISAATEYLYLRVPSGKRNTIHEQDGAIIGIRAQTGEVLAARAIRASASDPDDRSFLTAAGVLTRYGQAGGYDYWELAVTGIAPVSGDITVYFGRHAPIVTPPVEPGIPAVTAGGGAAVAGIWRGTQTQYDALTPDANTLYFVPSS